MNFLLMIKVLIFGNKKIKYSSELTDHIIDNGSSTFLHRNFLINKNNEIVGIRNFLGDEFPFSLNYKHCKSIREVF